MVLSAIGKKEKGGDFGLVSPCALQTGAAGAPVLRHAGANGVGTVTADEPTVLVGDHRPEFDAYHAMRAAPPFTLLGCRNQKQSSLSVLAANYLNLTNNSYCPTPHES